MLERPYKGEENSEENRLYKEFETKINEFVKAYLNEYIPCSYDKTKVIHDPVWGTCLFYGWELEILDSPLMQRLRNISQLGLTMLTYPTAHHSRFEHTLGVMSVITKMVNHINQETTTPTISGEDFYMLRLAALLHDVGHCFCSHLSESIYGKQKEFVNLKKNFEIFLTAKEHEIFAYIIINTEEFRKFIKNKVHLWGSNINIDRMLVDIGYMIVGANIPAKKLEDGTYERKYYLTQMINGQYDADKLDYLVAIASGLLCGMMDTIVGSIRGMGYGVVPTIVSMLGACGLRLLWIATIFQVPSLHTPEVLFFSYPVTWTMTFLAHLVCFVIMRRKFPKADE